MSKVAKRGTKFKILAMNEKRFLTLGSLSVLDDILICLLEYYSDDLGLHNDHFP